MGYDNWAECYWSRDWGREFGYSIVGFLLRFGLNDQCLSGQSQGFAMVASATVIANLRPRCAF